MKKNNCHRLTLLFSFSLLLILLTGCGGQQKAVTSPPLEEKIGVLDLNQAVRAHPKWQQIEEINSKIAILKQQYNEEINSSSPDQQLGQLQQEKIASQQLQLAEKQKEWDREQEILWQGLDKKMQAKKQEMEQLFQVELEKVQAEKKKELDDYGKQLKVLYGAQIVNLQLKLQFANLSEVERKKKKEELDNLTEEQQQKLQAKQQEVEDEMDRQMQATKLTITRELKDYQAQEEGKIKQQLESKYKIWQEAQQKAMSAQDQDWQQQVAAHEKQFAHKLQGIQKIEEQAKELEQQQGQIEESIVADLKDIAAQVAKKENLKAVVVNYRVNSLGVDVTSQVINLAKGLK